jgi:hypothetical protein
LFAFHTDNYSAKKQRVVALKATLSAIIWL